MTTGITLSTSGTFTHTNPFTVPSSIYATDGPAVVVYGSVDAGLYVSPPPWTVTNDGTLGAQNTCAVYFGAGGLLSNNGTINDGVRFGANNQRTFASAVVVNAGVSVSGQGVAAGSIGGYGYGVALRYFVSAGVTNLGRIATSGREGFGVLIASGANNALGTITNGSRDYGGAYIGGNVGVYVASGTVTNFGTIKGSLGIQFAYGLGTGGTVTNAGTIIGTGVHGAIQFGRGANELVIDPGAVFSGVVRGHAVYAGSGNEMELAGGAGVGTLTGLGSEYLNFNQVTIDAGANWYLSASNVTYPRGTFAVNGTLNVATAGIFTNRGTLLGTVTLQAGGSLANGYGGISAAGTAVLGAGAGAVVSNKGSIVGTGADGVGVQLDGSGQVLNQAFTDIASIQGYRAGVELAVAGAVVTNYNEIGGTQAGVVLDNGGEVVNRGGGATISGYDGIKATGGSIANDGTVSGFGGAGSGIEMERNGTITNGAAGGAAALIGGGYFGIDLKGVAGYYADGTISNAGAITGTGNAGIYLSYGAGSITNLADASISGQEYGIAAVKPAAGIPALNIVNAGTISGHTGISSLDVTTLNNSGTIIGSTGTAVVLGAGANLVVDHPGALFAGKVDGGSGSLNRLELAAGGAGTVSNLGTNFFHFATLAIDPGANWEISGNSNLAAAGTFINDGSITVDSLDTLETLAPLSADAGANGLLTIAGTGTAGLLGAVASSQTISFAGGSGLLQVGDAADFAGTIEGFVPGATIDLPGVSVTSAGVVGGVLIARGGGGVVADLTVTGSFANQRIVPGPDSGDGTALTVVNVLACFAAGTRIATATGETTVETLAIGQHVRSAFGGTVPVVWLGHRRIDCRRHPRPRDVWPVRVRAGAFGPGQPRRDLLLSPDHAVHVEDVLIPIRTLINGINIEQVPASTVTYWHIELPTHDVVLAEGLPAESYLDTGNRSAFENGGPALRLHPDFAQEVWAAAACAAQITFGPIHAAVVARLRAGAAMSQGEVAREGWTVG
jgi:hypothetical protein